MVFVGKNYLFSFNHSLLSLFIEFLHMSRFLFILFSMDVYTSFVKVKSYIVCQGCEKGNMQMLQSIYVTE